MPARIPFEDSDTPKPRYALVYAPGHKRERVPEHCVRLMENRSAALSGADTQQNLFPHWSSDRRGHRKVYEFFM